MMIDKKIRTRICTKDYFLREGIVSLLRSANYDVAEEMGDDVHDDCDIIVLCLDPRSRILDEIDPFRLAAPRAKIVVLAHLQDGGALPRQVLTRAAAILDRGITSRKLLVALEAVMIGVVVHDPAVLRSGQDVDEEDVRKVPAARPGGLTAMIPATLPLTHTFSSRERDILAALTEGLPNKVIARRYDIAEATVKVHVKHILRKLNMSNRTQAAIWVKSNAAMVA